MVELLIWILYISGITIIVTQSSIFKWFRDIMQKIHPFLGKLYKCPLCLGFWVGVVSPFTKGITESSFQNGVIGAISSFLIFAILWNLALKDPTI